MPTTPDDPVAPRRRLGRGGAAAPSQPAPAGEPGPEAETGPVAAEDVREPVALRAGPEPEDGGREPQPGPEPDAEVAPEPVGELAAPEELTEADAVIASASEPEPEAAPEPVAEPAAAGDRSEADAATEPEPGVVPGP